MCGVVVIELQNMLCITDVSSSIVVIVQRSWIFYIFVDILAKRIQKCCLLADVCT
jgi:hypothetical protein